MNREHVMRLLPDRPRQAVKRASTLGMRRDLNRLAKTYRTDKAIHDHSYTPLYVRHLPPRKAVRSLLEIGIGGITSKWGYETSEGGASLRMWQDYFPAAQIVGLDLYEKAVRGPRIHVEQGSQDDPEVLCRVAERHGPFDVIIDDGSHIGRHQIASFGRLFGALKPGGLYVIEDLETAYRDDFEGGPPGTPSTAATLLKDAVDAVLRRFWGGGDAPEIHELHVYDEIAFLVKAPSP